MPLASSPPWNRDVVGGLERTVAAYAQLLEIAMERRPGSGSAEHGFSIAHDSAVRSGFLSAAEAAWQQFFWSSLQDLDLPFEHSAMASTPDGANFDGVIRSTFARELLGRMLERAGAWQPFERSTAQPPLRLLPARADEPSLSPAAPGFIGAQFGRPVGPQRSAG